MTVSDYLDGLLDPEPGMLMTRRTQPAGQPGNMGPEGLTQEATAGKFDQPVEVRESFQELPPESYPAGTAALPLARTSRPWQSEDTAAAGETQQNDQGDNQASNADGKQIRLPARQPAESPVRGAPLAPGPNSSLPAGGTVSKSDGSAKS